MHAAWAKKSFMPGVDLPPQTIHAKVVAYDPDLQTPGSTVHGVVKSFYRNFPV